VRKTHHDSKVLGKKGKRKKKKKMVAVIRNKSCYYYLVPKHNTISACLQCFSAGFISFGGSASCPYKGIQRYSGKHKFADTYTHKCFSCP